MNKNMFLLMVFVTIFVIDTASAGCPPGLLPGYQLAEFQLCGAGIALAFETGGTGLVACTPLVGHIVINTAVNKLCDVNFYELKDDFFNPPGSGENLMSEAFYINTDKGYTDYGGLHCFYTSADGHSEVEMILPPYSSDVFEFSNYAEVKQIRIDGTYDFVHSNYKYGDINGDGVVNLNEVVEYIRLWKMNFISLGHVVDAINNWENSPEANSLTPEAKEQQKQYLSSQMNG